MTVSPSIKRLFPGLFALLTLLSISSAFLLEEDSEKRWQIVLTLIGASAAFVHFLYSRHIEEMRLLKELFTDFNKRYDSLNDALNAIVMRPDSMELSDVDIRVLYDYFNLCAEKFYFYKSGYIPKEVWFSWRRGIQFYAEFPGILGLLRSELMSDSYYGLKLEDIRSTQWDSGDM
jgi:hypothetical protein